MNNGFIYLIINIFLNIWLIGMGVTFLRGYYSGNLRAKYRVIIPIERMFFGKNIDDKVIYRANQVCFLGSCFGGVIGLINTFLELIIETPNLTFYYFIMTMFLVWIGRIIFIAYYRKRPEKLPKIWFFKN